ncbi:hypothetical protein EGW08_022510 [Elysia chlorotica]|uniref:Uncharacterized protein n=1 Tax=Elysia chlorotica TaxID=188477 RepID=A0A433SKS2_ELYCH|nr:hypothetical protein EGW08_022510 [Elysia chlorotica]
MEQDLSLMKQLLTLNETIEELKWQRQYYSSCYMSCASLSPSGYLQYRASGGGSVWSVSDTEMYESEDDFRHLVSPAVKSDSSAIATAAPAVPASSSGTVTPVSSSLSSLGMVHQHTQPPSKGHVTASAWHSLRRAKKASRDSDRFSLESPSSRNSHVDEAEGDLAAEVQAAIRKMDICTMKNGDSPVFPIASVDSYRSRYTDRCIQRDGKLKKEAVTYKVTPASPVSAGKSYTFTNDHLDLTPGPIIRHDRDQHSFDSGIHEPSLSEEIVWNV